ncbi:PA14 domain-containing protein [Chitinophaga sp. CF118]|uniref:PA14 domain-containing protein n=1 Tax=Chitinophaga sp. CF118 TaxID=1884367 RepID=UPI0008F04BBA|nr:PA14 domain-containing protein [Chitinophaga sp. CF118]SFE91001.1 PA14 domain-containing protein [Chitinophaga sp. CF118]
MILELSAKGKKTIASLMLALLYFETIIPSYALGVARTTGRYNAGVPAAVRSMSPLSVTDKRKSTPTRLIGKATPVKAEDLGGPTQPESQAFHSVNNDNMVDLFSGDFSYNIPLMDVGGYPIALGYNSGISMDQESSWVGLGWNINPGTITRNLRGLPDDFNGTDTIQKVAAIKPNKTIGVTVGANSELVGFPILGVGASVGIVNNSYKGWGIESGLNTSINVGSSSMGNLTSGLSFTNSSQEGLTVGGSLDYAMTKNIQSENKAITGNIGIGSSFNSRSGMKALQVYAGLEQYKTQAKLNPGSPTQPITVTTVRSDPNSKNRAIFGSQISFSSPTYTPSVTLPYTSTLYTFDLKVGGEIKIFHLNASLRGYVAKQEIRSADQHLALPAFGYLNSQNAKSNSAVLLDFNREKEIPYREKPAVPNIAVPAYTYDVFAMSGEGTGGMFRAYRGDIGFVHDHYMRTKDNSLGLGIDLGSGDLVHAGVDIGITRSYTESGPWSSLNPLGKTIAFKSSTGAFEAAYFRNPGEMTVNDKAFYNNIGDDDVVAVALNQAGNSDPDISTTHVLNRYHNKNLVGQQTLSPRNVTKATRDKRTQVISYLTAAEASIGGLSKYIENYRENQYGINNCAVAFPEEIDGKGVGLLGEFYTQDYHEKLFERIDTVVNISNKDQMNAGSPQGSRILDRSFNARWTGRLKADVTGAYKLYTISDDGVRLYLNDSMVIDRWNVHSAEVGNDSTLVNLVAGQFYNIRLEYFNAKENIVMKLQWKYPSQERIRIPTSNLYLMPSKDTVAGPVLSREKRVNNFRRENHISEIDVLNSDGRRYIYGIPVYNLKQKETSFSVDAGRGSVTAGLVKYTPGIDNSVNNTNGNDRYYSSELMPAYAHSFLLTGILSPDYQDLTGDGITPDDRGDAIKFNYTKLAGVKNPYAWRVPATDSANYNEGLKTDNRDDKGSYVYGEKELWYLNSIESKNMIATFKMSERKDMAAINEDGIRQGGKITRKLDEINLYNKADFNKPNRKPVKTVHFQYTYELCMGVNGAVSDSGKLTLKRVWFTYNGNDKGQRNPYIFNYNNNNPSYNSKSYDRWGNYKPAIQNPGSSTDNLITNGDYPYALQDSTLAAQNAAAWTLDSIVLPSGGRIKIDYESDDYGFVQNKRAAQMYSVAGFSATEPDNLDDLKSDLYGLIDYQFIAINVPKAVKSKEEVYTRYLEGMEKLYFRMYVNVPSDKFGGGKEFVPCYATLDPNRYGFFNDGNTIWVRVKAINTKGQLDMATSIYSPLATAAIQYLRQNLPSKAYPGSDVGDDIGLEDAVKVLLSQADNVMTAMVSFDRVARIKQLARIVDVSRTYVRLNNPFYKKLGGGIRVKRVRIYDHWDAMTKQRESVYGQEYQYTTTREVNGVKEQISSGVATYEPMLGGEENPWRVPIEYDQQVAPLAPTSLGYTEEPLGESLFPSPSVGYGKVRVTSIHAKNIRSANGFVESCFYTSYDFPTLVDMTMLADGKKRFKPVLTNFLKINVRHFIGLSQGFKIELNDMNGKLRSQGTYAATDPDKAVSYTENFYRVDNQQAEFKHLSNIVKTIDPQGKIDTTTTIGKDLELMMDMREQRSVTTAANLNINADFFSFAWPPVWLIPALLSLYHREETRYNSVAATKVINRHGILERTITIDKGSQVTAENLLYDKETGNVVLTSTKNEFEDPLYNFSWSAGWAYDGMSGAYKNIDVVLDHIYINQGRITNGPAVTDYFSAGDEILVGSKQKTGGEDCNPDIATFRAPGMIYVVDANVLKGGAVDLYFVDREGAPFTGNDISLKIIRSGRRNINTSVGEISLMANPLVQTDAGYILSFDSTKVLGAGAVEFKQVWKVADKMKAGKVLSCVATGYPDYAGDDQPGCDESGTTYANMATGQSYSNQGCPVGTDYPVLYKVSANKYTSTISQADANAKAWQEVLDSGQIFANIHGRCKQVPGLMHSYANITEEGSLFDIISDLARKSDSTYILAGSTLGIADITGENTGAYLLKTDYKGNVMWAKSYGREGICRFGKVRVTSDGGYIAIGTEKNLDNTASSAFIVKTNNMGDTTWCRRISYNTTNGEQGVDIIQLNDDSYAFVGTYDASDNTVDLMIGRLSSDGNAMWTRKIGNASGDIVTNLIQNNDTLVVVGGTYSNWGYDGIVLKMQKNTGALVSSYRYDLNIANTTNFSGFIHKTSTGYALNFGNTGEDGSNYNSLLTINENGDILSKKLFSKPFDRTASSLMPFCPTSDGGFMAVQNFNYNKLSWQKINANQTIAWSNWTMVKDGTYPFLNKILQNPDGSYVGAGTNSNAGFLMFTQPSGKEGCADSSLTIDYTDMYGSVNKNINNMMKNDALPNGVFRVSCHIGIHHPAHTVIGCPEVFANEITDAAASSTVSKAVANSKATGSLSTKKSSASSTVSKAAVNSKAMSSLRTKKSSGARSLPKK